MALNREDMEPMTGMVEEERRLIKVSMDLPLVTAASRPNLTAAEATCSC